MNNLTSSHKNCLPVYQYDKEGNFIKKWKSRTEACKELYIKDVSISRCCNRRQNTAGGYMWSNEYKENILKD